MIFETDQQTLNDLNILGKYKPNSIYSLFCKTMTGGGEVLLEQMFMNPLTDAEKIKERVRIFAWFKLHAIEFPVDEEDCEEVEQYLSTGTYRRLRKMIEVTKLRFMEMVGNDPRLDMWREQIMASIHFLIKMQAYLVALDDSILQIPLGDSVKAMRQMFGCSEMQLLLRHKDVKRLNMKQVYECDRIMQGLLHEGLQELLELVYQLDVATAVGVIARKKDFCFAEIDNESECSVRVEGVHHPCVDKAVSNDMEITASKNLFFLTGANMAGKSTLMKSFSIAVYLAHMGFPIAATSMRFKIQQGLYTSINVSDNLNMGYSHFYAEVLRVKKVAIEVAQGKRLVVVFDELFKGTNVKDAYDATLAVTAALAECPNCSLLISTHIIEVAEDLKRQRDNINFEYLPTVMKGSVPTYTYKLQEGVTHDKHGMIIIRNERVIETIMGNRKPVA